MTTGLRERKKAATRFALHEAALRLVAEHGLDGVSVDGIAARADVSPRTFFNHFATKDDAVLGLDPAGLRRTAQALAARPADESAVEALRAVQREQAEEMTGETELWPLRCRDAVTNRLAANLTGALQDNAQRAVAAGNTSPDSLVPQAVEAAGEPLRTAIVDAYAVALLLAPFLREIPLSDVAGMVARGEAVTGDDVDRRDDDAREAAPAC